MPKLSTTAWGQVVGTIDCCLLCCLDQLPCGITACLPTEKRICKPEMSVEPPPSDQARERVCTDLMHPMQAVQAPTFCVSAISRGCSKLVHSSQINAELCLIAESAGGQSPQFPGATPFPFCLTAISNMYLKLMTTLDTQGGLRKPTTAQPTASLFAWLKKGSGS